MKITVVGAGYVGLVTAACLAKLGVKVVCLDKDIFRVQMLSKGQVPIYEPGLNELLSQNLAEGRLQFTTDAQMAIEHAEAVFIAVGTPPQEDGSADLSHVLTVAGLIGQYMTEHKLVINKSTVPVGTADKVRQVIATALAARERTDLSHDVVSNPEFLKEGAAIDDFMHPDRIVVGIDEGPHAAHSKRLLQSLYASFNRHHERMVWMDVRSAELTKYAANAMLATRISFMNEIAQLADSLGADIDKVRRGIGSDSRIGPSFLYAGCGYGGSCFPKDTRALVQAASEQGLEMEMVQATEKVNAKQKLRLVERLLQIYGPDLTGLKVAVWGLAFKPNTDDVREATSRVLIRRLLELGAEVAGFDPVAGQETLSALRTDCTDQPALLQGFKLAECEMQALEDADVLMVVTEWKLFQNPDFEAMKKSMRLPCILDGRNLYDPQDLQAMGIAYQGIGRGNSLFKELAAMHQHWDPLHSSSERTAVAARHLAEFVSR